MKWEKIPLHVFVEDILRDSLDFFCWNDLFVVVRDGISKGNVHEKNDEVFSKTSTLKKKKTHIGKDFLD